MPDKHGIAILGGGMSALVAAFELTRDSDWRDRYGPITVYQAGWRLGGKGASAPNRSEYDRIEEHGLHLFFGFYENACRVMRDCYRELDRPQGSPLATWRDAFKGQNFVVFEEEVRPGEWRRWAIDFPERGGLPGDGGIFPDSWNYVQLILDWLARRVEESELTPFSSGFWSSARENLDRQVSGLADDSKSFFADPFGALKGIVSDVTELATNAAEDLVDAVEDSILFVHTALALANRLLGPPNQADQDAILGLVTDYRDWVGRRLSDLDTAGDTLRRFYILVDLGVACLVGMFADGLVRLPPQEWWTAVDDEDFCEWAIRHGAEESSARCTLIKTLYALAFSEESDIGAGTGLHGMVRLLFTYKGSVIWKMQAGMGETIFAPLYEVLERRGVEFKFFHRVEKLRLSADRTRVSAIEISEQAKVREGQQFKPLEPVNGLPAWHDPGSYCEQLTDCDVVKTGGYDLEVFWTDWKDTGDPITLREGTDFDTVVMGISIAALPYVCEDLLQEDPRLRTMTEKVQTTMTQGVQLWLRKDRAALGWDTGKPPIIGAFAKPLDTWADMSHLLGRESWGQNGPKSIAYLCGALPDDGPIGAPGEPEYYRRQRARIRDVAIRWLEHHGGTLWPGAADANDASAIDWNELVDRSNGSGSQRFDAQHCHVTKSLSDRYVLSVPGSAKFRVSSDERLFGNVFFVGDYTFTAINAGCIEAASMSGLRAARAISGKAIDILGDPPL